MATTNPLLESDILICPHNGIINLKSNNGSLLEIEGAGVITQSDLLNASIVGCINSIAGFPHPCALIATIPPNAISSMLEVNNEGVILQSQIHTILTDKGFPIQIQTKSPNNEVYLDDRDNLASEIDENPNKIGDDENSNDKIESQNNSNQTKNNEIFKDSDNGDDTSKDNIKDNTQESYDEAFQIVDSNDKPLASIRYKITTENGDEIYGITDKNGYTKRISTQKEETINIEILG